MLGEAWLRVRRKLQGWRGGLPRHEECRLSLNIGPNVLEWPQRAALALEMVAAREKGGAFKVADYGCGAQTLRRMLPPGWGYFPFDYLPRSADTVVCDFDSEMPAGRFDAVFCLGVLEYLARPLALLGHAVHSGELVAFSYNAYTTSERREVQGWANNLTLEEIEGAIAGAGGTVLEKREMAKNEWLYLVQGALAR